MKSPGNPIYSSFSCINLIIHEWPVVISMAGKNPPNHMRDVILNNIKKLQPYKKMGLNIRVKVYSHKPIFRIAVVDSGRKIFVGSYNPENDGHDLPQIILDQDSNNTLAEDLLHKQFLDYFLVMWEDRSLFEVDIERINDGNYLKLISKRL